MAKGRAKRDGRRMLTREQEMLVRRLISAGATQVAAAIAAGVSYSLLRTRMNDQLRDLRVGRGRGGGRGSFQDLDPSEIAARAAALRATWTPERRMEAWNPSWRPLPDFAGDEDAARLPRQTEAARGDI